MISVCLLAGFNLHVIRRATRSSHFLPLYGVAPLAFVSLDYVLGWLITVHIIGHIHSRGVRVLGVVNDVSNYDLRAFSVGPKGGMERDWSITG